MIVVLDTNVWISAVLNSAGRPARVAAGVADGTFVAVSTIHLWTELLAALAQPHLRTALERKDGWELACAAIAVAQQAVVLVPAIPPRAAWVPADPDDNWVIQCALTAKAEHIVSGYRHLLSLGQVEQVRIVSPAEFLSLLSEKT